MKKNFYLFIFILALVVQQIPLWAQSSDIITVVSPKVRMFPSSGLSYLDDPARYFSIQMINNSTETKQVYITLNLSCDFSADNSSFFLTTKKEYQPMQSVSIAPGQSRFLTRTDFDLLLGNLSRDALHTNMDRDKLLSDLLTLPEGQYRLCLTPYEWTGQPSNNPRQLGAETCVSFTICYSGSAPEFTMPINGFSAANLNNSNPTNNLLRSAPKRVVTREKVIQPTQTSLTQRTISSSDNRNSSQYAIVPLQKTVNFSWIGVVSNCLSSNDFNYTLKLVEVHQNQNVQDAINQNATIATVLNGSKTTYVHDTLANRHFRLQHGHVYAAQVQATLKKNMLNEVKLSNEGKSQIITFVWGDGPIQQSADQGPSMTSKVTDNRDQVVAQMRKPFFVNPGKDKELISTFTGAAATEAATLKAGSGTLVENEESVAYYQLPVSDSLLINWMPARSDSLLRARYKLSLYEYVGGEVELSLNKQPILTKDIVLEAPQANFAMDQSELMKHMDSAWHKKMQEGYKYLLTLETKVGFSYRKTTTYTITEYIHSTPVMRDSVVHSVAFDDEDFLSNIVFAWGIDSSNLDKVLPPQFTFPVDLTKKAVGDTLWSESEFPKVSKREDFSFRWEKPKGVNYGDSVYYKLSVGEFPKGKKPWQVKKFEYYVKDSITATEYMDTVLFDSLKTGKNYVVMVQARIKQLTDTSNHYNIVNEGKSHHAAFQLQDPPTFEADLNTKIVCNPKALEELSKEVITPSADSLAKNNVRLMMGEFPLVVQRCEVDKSKDGNKGKGEDKGDKEKGGEKGGDKAGDKSGDKSGDKDDKGDKGKENTTTYSGDGYIIWNPIGSGIDVRLKVHFDSIQINKNYQIIRGTAVSSVTDSATYLPALERDLGVDDMEEAADDAISNIVTTLGDNKKVKGYYDKFKDYYTKFKNKYGEEIAKKYGGLAGPLSGDNIGTPVLTFPLSVTDKKLSGSENIIFSINNMYFSPVTALMNIWAIFAAQDDNMYVPFLANNICMDKNRLLGNSSQHMELYMARDYEFALKDGYKMRFKKSSTFSNPQDGTVIVLDTGKLDYMIAEIQFDMDPNDVMGIAKDGTPQHGKIVTAGLRAKLRDWDDWIANIYMDPFAVKGADRFTFVPTGKGIYYDHSNTETPKVVKFPKDYIVGMGLIDTTGLKNKELADAEKKNKEIMAKATKEWQGFYWDELSVFLSDEISNTFTDIDSLKTRMDSVVSYKYGLNNTITDSAHYSFPGSRINFGARGLIIDTAGFTSDFYAQDIIRASTDKGWGWAFSLDTIAIKIIKNKYQEGFIKGGFGVPLFSSGFSYNCFIGKDSLDFSIKSVSDTLNLDIWMAKVLFNTKSSYFKIQKIYKEERTRIDLTLNGKINIDFSKIGVPINYDKISFEGLGMRNYSKSKDAALAQFHDFDFDMGNWSFASPQKTLGGTASNGAGEQVPLGMSAQAAKDKPIGSIKAGGFTFSLTKFKPIIGLDKKNLKLGFDVEGQIKFATEGTDLGASCGFSLWGVVDPLNKFEVKDVDASLNKIQFDEIDFEIFKLDGELEFFDKSQSSTNGDGFGGSLSVSFMGGITLSMKVGFGKKDDFSWWYFDGACKFPGGIPLGAVSINGFSGGFAYNMGSKYSLTDPKFSAKGLLSVAEKHTNETLAKSSGMDFEPKKGSWVANAGISLVLTGAESTMNADGLVSLRIANKHFSGIFIEANAYVLSKMDKTKTPGDGGNNSSPLIKATAIIGFETTQDYDYFRLSLAAKADLSLSSLFEGISSTALGSKLGAIHGGSSLLTSSNITSKLNSLLGGKTGLTSHGEEKREQAESNNSSAGNKPTISAGLSISIPIDFELKHYKKAKVENGISHKKGSTDWYFAIGKPNYADRVNLKQDISIDIGVAGFHAVTEFTFYLQTGNAFAYQMPALSTALQNFFGINNSEKQLDTDKEEIKRNRRIPNNDWLKIDNGGGFCMGATYHSELSFNFFLYMDLVADLGFDVALLNVNGQGCPGYAQIGKHYFYAMGQVYAALQGDVGLKLNLGFWKGKISLFSAGVGALLQGGGPNPSYCYGLLRFKVSLLDGLLNFSTSTDFKVGDVCVPGAGDPLANVQLFQNVTPGFTTESAAKQKQNTQNPLQIGMIVSNMPWDRDVFLADEDGSNPRKFWFTLMENKCKYQIKEGSSYRNAVGSQIMEYRETRNDANALLFETKEGGFAANKCNKIYLEARAFEWRSRVPSKELSKVTNTSKQDKPYYIYGTSKGTQKNDTRYNQYDWYDPTFIDETNNKKIVREYKRDTTMYFETKPLANNLEGQVVYSWPYNGDICFPNKEYLHAGNTPYAVLYLDKNRPEFFDKTMLTNNNKSLRIFIESERDKNLNNTKCTYSYYTNGAVPKLKVTLPSSMYGKALGAIKLHFIIVPDDEYNKASEAAKQALTKQEKEYKSRIDVYTYRQAENAHNANNPKMGKKKLNLRNQMLEEIYESKQTDGKDSMTYLRTKAATEFKLCSSVGEEIYTWTWFTALGKYATYEEALKWDMVSTGNLKNDLKKSTITSNSSTSITIKSDKSRNCYWYFAEYDPRDAKRYNTSYTMPPRAFFGLQNGGDPNINNMHNEYFQHFLDMEKDFKSTSLLKTRYSDNSGKYNVDGYGRNTYDASMESNLKTRLKTGFIKSNIHSFTEINSRIKGGTNFTPCDGNRYHPTTIDKPTLLKFTVTSGEIPPLDEKYFQESYSYSTPLLDQIKWTIYDRATPAMINDIRLFHDFMQEMQIHANAYDNRGWSHKVDIFNDHYSKSKYNANFAPGNFPFEIPEIYRVTHYMKALDETIGRNVRGILYPLGGFFPYYGDEMFIWNSSLRKADACWAKYWWSAEGTPCDRGDYGFDREFYEYDDKNKEYYCVTSNQANNGKRKYSTPQKDVLGKWYDTKHFSSFSYAGAYNLSPKIAIYYLTSQKPDFENTLMKIAVAIRESKNDPSAVIFYPNAILNTNLNYEVFLNSTNLLLKNLRASAHLTVKNKY